ncbi:MAG: small multi-drug export protein [Lachnospiraceae bacterium]|nr:small multi-drug export protein [Lachnospiraceae bacterium]
MDSLVQWFTQNLSPYISEHAVIFIISLLPILELRGGLLAASLLKVPYLQALPICVIGNLLPIPFILLFIKQIFKWMKKAKVFRPMIEWLENKAMKRSDNIQKGEFWGLVAFVGIPLPGTGAWTGALIASLLGIDVKKSSKAILLGVVIASVIMSLVSYVFVGKMVS